jgi:hypothetical protein
VADLLEYLSHLGAIPVKAWTGSLLGALAAGLMAFCWPSLPDLGAACAAFMVGGFSAGVIYSFVFGHVPLCDPVEKPK